MRLSVLDQSTASKGRTQDTAIREPLELARHCDALGYHRYWVSEHHNSGSIVGTAPEVLMSAIAATTPRIRVGSAGVMLPHYSALKVAEQFRVLEAIAPGRIDLGIGRAPGSDQLTSYALNPNPLATICVWALAADTEEEALHQFKTRERAIVDRRQGIRLPLMSPEEAERPYSPVELATAEKLRRKAIVGTAEQVAARLKELA